MIKLPGVSFFLHSLGEGEGRGGDLTMSCKLKGRKVLVPLEIGPSQNCPG